MFRNRNAGDVNAWTYVPDESHQAEGRQQLEERERSTDVAGLAHATSSISIGTNSATARSATTAARRPPHRRRATTTSRRRGCSRRRGHRRRRAACCYEAGFGTNLIMNYGPKPNLDNSNAMIPVHRAVLGRLPEQRRHCEPELPREQLVHRRQQRVQLARRRDRTSPAVTAPRSGISRSSSTTSSPIHARTTPG